MEKSKSCIVKPSAQALAWLVREQEQNRNSLTYWQRQKASPLQEAKVSEREQLATWHRELVAALCERSGGPAKPLTEAEYLEGLENW